MRVSPLGHRSTVTLTLFALAAAGMVLYAVSGQALGLGRYIAAFVRWRCGPASFDAAAPVMGGVLVDTVPLVLAGAVDETCGGPTKAKSTGHVQLHTVRRGHGL